MKRTRIKPVSDKQKNRLVEYKRLADSYKASNPLCEARLVGCSMIASDIHHKAGRDGENLFRDFMSVCRSCHNQIEEMGKEVYEKGYKIRRV